MGVAPQDLKHVRDVHGKTIIGDNNTRALATKDELDNVNLITGLAGFFAPGPVSFDGGNIILGGAGNDAIKGGGGDDIIDGDAWLHVALTSYSAGGQIIRSIQYDPNGNGTVQVDANGNLVTGAVHAANVDTAVFNDVFANYGNGFFGPFILDANFNAVDAEGFLTIKHTGTTAVVGGNPQGLAGVDDGTDRIRNIERLQFADATVAALDRLPASDGLAPGDGARPRSRPDHTAGRVLLWRLSAGGGDGGAVAGDGRGQARG